MSVCVHVSVTGGKDLECSANDGRRQPGPESSIFFLCMCLETLPKAVMITMQGSSVSSGLTWFIMSEGVDAGGRVEPGRLPFIPAAQRSTQQHPAKAAVREEAAGGAN